MKALFAMMLAVLLLSGNVPTDAAAPVAHDDGLSALIQLFERYPLFFNSNIIYRTVNNFDAKLDVYEPLGNTQPRPTLMFIHGGGWLGSFNKETYHFIFLPFLQRG